MELDFVKCKYGRYKVLKSNTLVGSLQQCTNSHYFLVPARCSIFTANQLMEIATFIRGIGKVNEETIPIDKR